VVGSNLPNVLVILGVTSVLVTLKVARTTIRYEIPFMILITFLLLAMGKTGNQISFWEGIILWVFFLAYLFYLLQMAKKNQQTEEKVQKFKPVWRLLLSIVVGVTLIILGSDVSVDAASEIARSIGFSERLIGLTIVALGTSLPELVTSVSAARKGKADIAIGNVVGSNVFNILFVVGTTALVTPVAFATNFILDTILVAGSGILLWLLVRKNHHLTRKGGILLLAAYCIYMVYLLV
jgi:cation:H+ antiporter